jgi:hypothetical protein
MGKERKPTKDEENSIAWMLIASIEEGAIFRKVTRSGKVSSQALKKTEGYKKL